MSEPHRLVESSESEVERLLLRAGRDGAPPEGRQRVLLAATGAVTASTLTAGTATGAAAAGTAAVGGKATSLLSLKWFVVIGLASMGAVAGTVAVHAARDQAPSQGTEPATDVEAGTSPRRGTTLAAPSGQRASAPPPAPLVESRAVGPPTPGTFAPVVALPSRAPPAGAGRSMIPGDEAPLSAAPSAAVELTMLDEARRVLAQGDAPSALSILDGYVRTFPRGALRPEASVLRIEALAAAGDRPAATRAAQSFLQEHPESPYAQRIRSLLDAPNP